MARCTSCNKMCSLTVEEPEEQSIDIEGTEEPTVTAQVRIERRSECCGDSVKEVIFDFEMAVVAYHEKDSDDVVDYRKCTQTEGHEWELDDPTYDTVEEGGGRYAKSYYGVVINVDATCKGCELRATFEDSEKCAASEFETTNE